MQHTERGARALAAYHKYLQDDHDFKVWADVLDMEERPVSSVDLLDGQKNFAKPDGPDGGPESTASIVISDPEGALEFGTSYAEDPTGTIWVNRIVRVMHEVNIPSGDAQGRWRTVAFIGVPVSASRSGGEVSLELADKSILADHGVRPFKVQKGMDVHAALVKIIRATGERHYRISKPKKKKKLSKTYIIGMGENQLTPWQAFKSIAGKELGYRAFMSSDGYATAEPTSANHTAKVEWILNLPESSASFTDFINYVKVTSKRKPKNKKKGKDKGKTQPKSNVALIVFETIATLTPGHRLSEQSLNRHGVPRTLPLVIDNNNLKDGKAVSKEALTELKKGSDIEGERALECMPFFHLDSGDYLDFPLGIGKVAWDEASVPFGTGGNMTLGANKWVSRAVKTGRRRSKRTVVKKKKKGGKGNRG